MTGARYQCCDEGRREKLLDPAAPANLSGVDYVEVFAGETTLLPTIIVVTLVKPLPSAVAALTTSNIRITGGVRHPAPAPGSVEMEPAGPTVERYRITIAANQPTDYSLYRLALVEGQKSDAPPAFIDPRLSAVDIDFKIACAADGDCAPDCAEPVQAAPFEAAFDYRARDWPGFRQLMLDRLAALVPGFRRDDPLDLTTTLVEALAAEKDRLSYRLDWLGVEALMPTARSRTSVARHARLVDYVPGEGVSARTFASFALDGMARLELPKGTPLLLRQDGLAPVAPASAWPLLIAQEPTVFETCADATVWPWRNAIAIHTWMDDQCRLPAGSISVTLVDGSAGPDDALKPGDLLLLREIASPDTGLDADARPGRRHVVRLTRVAEVKDALDAALRLVDVEWDAADALPFELVVQAQPPEGGMAAATVTCADAAANIVLCDHGLSLPPVDGLKLPPSATAALRPRLDPPAPEAGRPWRPTLDRADLSRGPQGDDPAAPASRLLAAPASEALPRLTLVDAFSTWNARPDLLRSGPFSRDFVIEAGMDGRAQLRFGDDVHGLAPTPGGPYAVRGRFGFGPDGNIGPDALGHVVLADAVAGANLRVSNPLPAVGGAAPEPIASVRLHAPHAFRRRDRAVTPADYAEMARRHPEVSAALAVPRWTGAFQTMLVYVDRKGGRPVDGRFRAEIARSLERYRLMGVDVAVRGAVARPLDVGLFVCAKPGELRSAVAGRVRDALRPRRPDGGQGFFHPDRFSFGEPLRLSALVAAVMAVEGVQSVEVQTFQRYARPDHGELAAGVIRAVGPEVLQLEDDPNFPERGRLRVAMGGGR